ncbi:MAG: hypothetical protein AB7D03_11545 [Thiomicrospira sp.]
MKQFLRYQISGMVFIGWLAILYYSTITASLPEAIKSILQQEWKIIGGAVSALPVGVLIHQLSVLIKNWVFGSFIKVLSDKPNTFKFDGLQCKKKAEYTKYILERVSNLNTFFYVRFDNGVLAPTLALATFLIYFEVTYSPAFCHSLLLMALIGTITFSYSYRIVSELKLYKKLLKKRSKNCD